MSKRYDDEVETFFEWTASSSNEPLSSCLSDPKPVSRYNETKHFTSLSNKATLDITTAGRTSNEKMNNTDSVLNKERSCEFLNTNATSMSTPQHMSNTNANRSTSISDANIATISTNTSSHATTSLGRRHTSYAPHLPSVYASDGTMYLSYIIWIPRIQSINSLGSQAR
ncbi:hypothetical protein M422DRAFT_42757 [Sphaerobolus stellatus SS14]|nr:hypothetical protein M422DRAFT_42757 [Sphaerobolus stellatus SS14]